VRRVRGHGDVRDASESEPKAERHVAD
jgi:hypothetical protein